MKSLEAADRTLYNKQNSRCQASTLETKGAEQMTNKSIGNIHSYSLIYELFSAVNVVHAVFLRHRVVKLNYYGTDFYVFFYRNKISYVL